MVKQMNPDSSLKPDYCIEIDFKKDTENPSRVFRSMSDLIDAFQRADKQLVNIIDVNIQPVLFLEDVETSSIKAWLRTALERIPNDSLYNLDWKPIIGQYLVKGKQYIIDWTNGKTTVTNVSELKPLEDQLHALAESTNIKLLPAYNPIKTRELLETLRDLSEGVAPLMEGDSVKYITEHQESTFNLAFKLTPEVIENLITKETTTMTGEQILKIKKPDYLGESMWEVKHGKDTFPASIADKAWLQKFQSGTIPIVPGDSIRAIVTEEYKYDYNQNLIAERRNVEKVIEVIHGPEQSDMFEGNNH